MDTTHRRHPDDWRLASYPEWNRLSALALMLFFASLPLLEASLPTHQQP